jgi:GNAT superfamily N-acetyltransferase
MWNSLPIQTKKDKGIEFTRIEPTFQYERFSDVEVTTWNDAPSDIKTWCRNVWRDQFKTERDPISENDLVGWIPSKGIITAKFGKWVGEIRSRPAVYVNYLYVDPKYRSQGLAKHLILSVSHEANNKAGTSSVFLFETDVIPKSLTSRGAQALCRYHYVWLPFLFDAPPSDCRSRYWTADTDLSILHQEKGFHGTVEGFKLFRKINSTDKVLFDCNNDIVWYTSFLSLFTFDGFDSKGAFCRVFSPFGNSAVYAENMYFSPTYTSHYLLG